MKKGWKKLNEIGGLDKRHVLASQIFIFSFAIENIITGISRGGAAEYYLKFCLPFFIIPAIFQFLKTRYIFSMIYFVLGIVMVATGTLGNFSGLLYLIFSVYLFKNPKFDIVVLSIMTLAISFNSYRNQFIPSQLFIMIRVYSLSYLIYFFTIRADQKKLDDPILTFSNVYLLPNEKELIRLLFLGHTRQEIYGIMNKSKNTVTGYQNSIMGKCHAKTFEECLLRLGKSVKIDVIGNVDNK